VSSDIWHRSHRVVTAALGGIGRCLKRSVFCPCPNVLMRGYSRVEPDGRLCHTVDLKCETPLSSYNNNNNNIRLL